MKNNPTNTISGRQRRGVGAIIGGVILAAILVTTVLVYFITILNNEKTRTSYEILASQVEEQKSAEKLTAARDTDLINSGGNLYINTRMSNNGSLPLIVSRAVMYCVSASGCPTPNDPTDDSTSVTLNPGEPSSRNVGPVSNTLTYRVDFITERGNIVATRECTVDSTLEICSNDNTSGVPDFSVTAEPPSQAIQVGATGTISVLVGSVNGFSSPVTLSFSVSPSTGMTLPTLSPGTVTPPDTSTMTIATDEDDTPGTYIITVTGTSGSTTHSDVVSVTLLEPPDITGAVNEGIVQGTGSLQLDFRAFGAIIPQLGDRDGVPQKGWEVVTASKYGAATGYPAFEIPYHSHVFFVERMRNLDPSGEDITLTRKTALITNQGTIPAGQQSVVYICKENPSASDGVEAYNEQSAFKIIPNTPIDADPTVGWVDVYFCSENPGTDYIVGNGSCGPSAASGGYCPEHTNSQLNGIIMVARGSFTPSLSQYGQTIPYQSSQPGLTDHTTFFWCLYESDSNSPCPAPASTSADPLLAYTADRASMQAGVDIFAHYRDTSSSLPNPGATITWIYPDGTGAVLADNQGLVNQNIPISLPTTNSDGITPIDCAPGQTEAFYVLKINDNFSTEGTRNVYYMTFRMSC